MFDSKLVEQLEKQQRLIVQAYTKLPASSLAEVLSSTKKLGQLPHYVSRK